MAELKKFPKPFMALSYPLKLMVIADHYTYHKTNNKTCVNCKFMRAVMNDFDKLKLTSKDVEKCTMMPEEFLKYYMGDPDIKNEMERHTNGKSMVQFENEQLIASGVFPPETETPDLKGIK